MQLPIFRDCVYISVSLSGEVRGLVEAVCEEEKKLWIWERKGLEWKGISLVGMMGWRGAGDEGCCFFVWMDNETCLGESKNRGFLSKNFVHSEQRHHTHTEYSNCNYVRTPDRLLLCARHSDNWTLTLCIRGFILKETSSAVCRCRALSNQ